MSRLTFFGWLEGDRVMLPPRFHKMIKELGLHRFKMVVSEDRPSTSLKQHKYWRGVIVPHILEGLRDAGHGWLSPHCKEHLQCVHEFICERFLPEGNTLRSPCGFSKTERGKTSEQNTKEMTDLIEQVRQWSLDIFGIYIPVPEELEDEQEQLQDNVNRNIGNY